MKTLKQLIHTNSYKPVFNEINRTFLRGKSNAEKSNFDINFLSVWNSLEKLKVSEKTSPLQIHLTEIEDNEESRVDVALLDSGVDELFAMDFVSWDELINLPVYFGGAITETQCLAHILWEITFWGFTQEQINKQLNLLIDAKND